MFGKQSLLQIEKSDTIIALLKCYFYWNTMYNKSVKSLILFFLCFFSMYTKSMEITPRGLFLGTAIAALAGLYWYNNSGDIDAQQKGDTDASQENIIPFICSQDPLPECLTAYKNKDLHVITKDGHSVVIPSGILRYCERLKLACYFYRNDTTKPLPVKFYKNELENFITAFHNPTFIDDGGDLSIIMPTLEKCSAYLLYAFCVSKFLTSDADALVFDFFKQLIKPSLVTNPILYRMITVSVPRMIDLLYDSHFSAVIQNKNYYVEQERGELNYTVFNCKGEPVYNFSDMSPDNLYLFKRRNIILYPKGRSTIL